MGVAYDEERGVSSVIMMMFQGRSTATAAWRGSTATATTASASTAMGRRGTVARAAPSTTSSLV